MNNHKYSKTVNRQENDFKEGLESARKVLDKLVFEKLNIEYDMKTEYNRYKEKWYFNIWLDVDVDRMNPASPTYDSKYDDYLYNLEDKIDIALRYVNQQDKFGGLIYDYYNDDFSENQVDELNRKLFRELENLYNVRPHEIQESDTFYYIYKSESDNPYIRVEGLGTPVEIYDKETQKSKVFYGCDSLSDLMFRLYQESDLKWEYEDFTCQ